MSESRPTVVFELRYVLMHNADPATGKRPVRPGIHHLLSLLQYFNVGVFNGVARPDDRAEETKLRTEKLPPIYEELTSNECIKNFMEKHGYNNPQKMFFDPIATLLDWEGLQKDPDTVVNLNPDRVIIIDDYGKYPQAGKWHSSVVQCMWPPADCPGHYQWESPDEFVPPSSGNPNWQVPVMRILCRLLIDALYDRSLHMTQTNVTAAVKDINQKLQLTLAMARNKERVWIESFQPTNLHHIMLKPQLPSQREVVIAFPRALQHTTTLAPTPLEQKDLYKTKPHSASRTPHVNEIHAMPGVLNIAFLRPYFRIGVFCNWAEVPARLATAKLNQALHSFLYPPEGASPEKRAAAHKLLQLVKQSRINPQDHCIEFLLHNHAGQAVRGCKNLQKLADKCIGIEPDNTLILDVATADRKKRLHTVTVPDLTNSKGGKNVPSKLDVAKGQYPLLRIISSVAVTSLGSHRSRRVATDTLQGVADDLQVILNQVWARAYKPPAGLGRILQTDFSWCHVPNAITLHKSRHLTYSDEALAPLCTSFVLRQKQLESEANIQRQQPHAAAMQQQQQVVGTAHARVAAPVPQHPQLRVHPHAAPAESIASAAQQPVAAAQPPLPAGAPPRAAVQLPLPPGGAPPGATAQRLLPPGALPGAAVRPPLPTGAQPGAAPQHSTHSSAPPAPAQPRPARGRAKKGLYARRPAPSAAPSPSTASTPAIPEQQNHSIPPAPPPASASPPAPPPDTMQMHVDSQQTAADALPNVHSVSGPRLAHLAVVSTQQPAPEQPSRGLDLRVPGLQTTAALSGSSAQPLAVAQVDPSATLPPGVAPAPPTAPERTEAEQQVPGLPPQSTAAAAAAAQAAEEPAAEKPVPGVEDDLSWIVEENAALLSAQAQENNPHHQRITTAEEMGYIEKGMRPPNFPSHTGFTFPERTVHLSLKHDFTELHFELYDLFIHTCPSHDFLDLIEATLDAMNDTIGQLSPPCQAVLHGSWASSLFALDSSLDITILEKGFRMPEGKGYHNTAFKDLVPGVSTYIKSQLNQVNEALTESKLQDEDEAEMKHQRYGYPMLQTKLRVPKLHQAARQRLLDAKITFGDVWGPQHAIDTAVQLQLYKLLRPLFLVLRHILHQRGLDNPEDGGLPPFILFLMIGANLALDAHTFQMETWVEKYGDDHGFEEYWDDTEPSYLAQLDPPAYDISVADQLEYVRLLGDIAEMDTVENGARVAEFEGGRNDLGLALHRFLNRFTPAEHEDSPVFDHTKNVISFHNRNILTLDVFNEEIRSQLAPLKYPGTGIMVEDPQNRRNLIGADVKKWDQVVALFDRVKRTIQQFEDKKSSGQLVSPVSDAKLRLVAKDYDVTMPDDIAMAPTTLVLGRLLSLDIAIGPSHWPEDSAKPTFDGLREEAVNIMEIMDEQGELLVE